MSDQTSGQQYQRFNAVDVDADSRIAAAYRLLAPKPEFQISDSLKTNASKSPKPLSATGPSPGSRHGSTLAQFASMPSIHPLMAALKPAAPHSLDLQIERDSVSFSTSDRSGQSASTQGTSTASTFSHASQIKIDNYLEDLALEDSVNDRPAPPAPELPTGFCYDVRMRYHCELEPPKDRRDYHPEDPRRIFAIYRELCFAGLISDPLLTGTRSLVAKPLQQIEVREISKSEVVLVHDSAHWEYMAETPDKTGAELMFESHMLDSVYFNGVTFACAKLSAGGAVETARAVSAGVVKNAIAIIRPPGHHAECNRPMGFCIFDNVSIAVKVCMLEFAESCKKVMILDWDVHHGNGIQQAFYNNPNVLYVSIHVHEDGTFYPAGPGGDHLHCGAGDGLGRNVNIPWPTKGMGDAEYMYALQRLIMPIAHEFNPDLIMIAAGFDAADGDELGGCHVTPGCFAQMTHALKSLAGGRIVVCLEGGYNLRSIARSALAVTRVLNGEPPPRLNKGDAVPSSITTVEKVVAEQSKYWSCLHSRRKRQVGQSDSPPGTRLHGIIRAYQTACMKQEFEMTEIPIYRQEFLGYSTQIMATHDFEFPKTVIVIFHDPPELLINADVTRAKRMQLHDAQLVDGCSDLVRWAISNGFAVADVNAPLIDSEADDEDEESNQAKRRTAINETAAYLWDNYITPNEQTELFFIGLGASYSGIMHLLNSRGEEFSRRVTGMINIVPSCSLPSPMDDGPTFPLIAASDQSNVSDIGKWYRSNSLIFVGQAHYIWHRDSTKKPSRRFGYLVKSDKDNLEDMLVEHQGRVKSWIEARIGARDSELEWKD